MLRSAVLVTLTVIALPPALHALEKQPNRAYHARRVALAGKLNGGVAVLFAAPEPLLDFMPYRQDSDFYYLTGWTEPGAALMVVSSDGKSRKYREILFLPSRNLRREKYTGPKLDAESPGVTRTTGVDAVEPMTELPAELNTLIAADRESAENVWVQPSSNQAKALLTFNAVTLGMDETPPARDVTSLTMELRQVKDAGEINLIRKATGASIAAQQEMMRVVKPGVTERTVAGKMGAVWLERGCERPSYAPIVGSG
ncbi:MAG TPA: aminopeptidase P N-terminal domain-containing protein, partial [Terriglobia bacterium]|nr:aminopeptidase P N-terminal domain-containing protein [Terriglobia bacterium]